MMLLTPMRQDGIDHYMRMIPQQISLYGGIHLNDVHENYPE